MNEECTSLTPAQAEFACRMIQRWMDVCEDYNRRTAGVDVAHSSLLRRLLLGKPFLDQPPPKRFSYPAYDMVEQDEVQILDMWEDKSSAIYGMREEKLYDGDVIVIDQHAAYVWDDKEAKIIRHVPTGLRFQYYEKTTYPQAVAVGEPENHPYVGKFLKRL